MPYDTIADLPQNLQDILPIHAQEIFQAAFNASEESTCRNRDDKETCSNAIAWAAVKRSYEKNDAGEWVEITTNSELMTEKERNEYRFDIAYVNNAGNIIKIRDFWLYLSDNEILDEALLKERLAQELGYSGMGSHLVYVHDPSINIGDEVSGELEPIYTVNITVSAKTAVFKSEINTKCVWIPVAAPGQESSGVLSGKFFKLNISEEALKSNLDSWKGGYINVDHEDGTKLKDYKIEDAKFENGLLYHKVDPDIVAFLAHEAISGSSIEIFPTKIEGDFVSEYMGKGLSLLFSPKKPACSKEMGCSNNKSFKEKIDTATLAIKSRLFNKNDALASELIPKQETTMTSETDILKSQLTSAEDARDEAIRERDLLKSSLSEKDVLISEQADKIAKFEAAEAARLEAVKDEQWNVLKSSIPRGMTHRPEDEAALKAEFLADPGAFAVKMLSWKKEASRGVSGAAYVPDVNENEDIRALREMNVKLGKVVA